MLLLFFLTQGKEEGMLIQEVTCKGNSVLPLTGRSVLISVRRHEASTRTRIKLTCKTESERQSEGGSEVKFLQ